MTPPDDEPSRLAREHDRLLPLMEHRIAKVEGRVEEVAKNAHAARDIASAAAGQVAILGDALSELRHDMRTARVEAGDMKREIKAEMLAMKAELQERHDRTDDTLKWVGRTVIGAVLAAALGLILVNGSNILAAARAATGG